MYLLTADGDIVASSPVGNMTSDVGDWLTPKSGMSNYQVRATHSRPACNAPAGTWQSLSSSQAWYITAGYPATYAYCYVFIEIRHSANPSVILDNAWITLTAIRN